MAENLRFEIRGKDGYTRCRLCLGENVQLLRVFESEGMPGWTAASAIKELLEIEVDKGDGYPQVICIECMQKLLDFKQFKRQCEINKDSLDLEYRRYCEVGANENVLGMVLCTNENHSDLYIKEEDLEVSIEEDPLDISDLEHPIKSEITESTNEITPDGVNGSAVQVSNAIKYENDDQVWTVPSTSTEAMKMNEGHSVMNSSSENILYSDHGEEEEVLDIKEEPCSDRSFQEDISRDPEPELTPNVNFNTCISKDKTGCSYIGDYASDAHSSLPQNNNRASRLSKMEDIFGNDDESTKSNHISSYTEWNYNSYNVSENVESEQKPLMLSECSEGYSIVSNLQNHKKILADGIVYKCRICFKKFPTPDRHTSHMLSHSGGNLIQSAESFKSNDCSKEFSENEHMRIHSKERQYSCNQCSKSYSYKKDLIRHMRIHSGERPERPYSCVECNKKFSRKGNLDTHLRTHSGERPYSCNQCSKSFSDKSSLNRHLRIHAGERPHSCNQCGKSFFRKGHLNNHMRIHS